MSGTIADFRVQEGWTEDPDWRWGRLRHLAMQVQQKGATYFRYTKDEEHDLLVVEGWKERPEQESPYEYQETNQ